MEEKKERNSRTEWGMSEKTHEATGVLNFPWSHLLSLCGGMSSRRPLWDKQ
jgi:hypothetical protein